MREALAAYEEAERRLKDLEAKRAELLTDADDAIAEHAQCTEAFELELGKDALGESSETAKARKALAVADERARGIRQALLATGKRIQDAEAAEKQAETRFFAVFNTDAAATLGRYRDQIAYHASVLGDLLSEFWQLEAATRGREADILTGVAAAKASGDPMHDLRNSGVTVTPDMYGAAYHLVPVSVLQKPKRTVRSVMQMLDAAEARSNEF